jgi:hypothetical protein
MAYTVIPTYSDAESRYSVALGGSVVSIVTRYSYSAQCWQMDLSDSLGNAILTGLMLVPGVDLLKPYPQIKRTLGSLLLVELTEGDYISPDSLGTTTKLLWFEPGLEVVYP